jgi:hypothetical protein
MCCVSHSHPNMSIYVIFVMKETNKLQLHVYMHMMSDMNFLNRN